LSDFFQPDFPDEINKREKSESFFETIKIKKIQIMAPSAPSGHVRVLFEELFLEQPTVGLLPDALP
jgi:hypothetical protein